MAKQLVCTLCGYAGAPKKKTKGSFLIEVVLWFFFIIPGLIYSLWRISNKQEICPKCGNTNMIPQDTPLGQKMMSEQPQTPQVSKEELATEEANRKHNRKVLWVVILIVFGLPLASAFIFGGKSEEKNNAVQPALQSTNKNSDKVVEYKELASYEKAGKTWRNIVIPSGTSQNDLIALAKELHTKDSKSYFHIFDDDEKFKEYMDWDMNYGKVKDKDGKIKQVDQCSDTTYCRTLVQQGKYAFPFPEAWGNKHDIAIINEISRKWKLSSPLGQEISDL